MALACRSPHPDSWALSRPHGNRRPRDPSTPGISRCTGWRSERSRCWWAVRRSAGITSRGRRPTERRRSRQVIGQFLPALVAGAFVTGALVRVSPALAVAAARVLVAVLRRGHLLGAAVRAAGQRIRRAVLLDSRAAAVVGVAGQRRCSRRGRSAERSASASCWRPLCFTGIWSEDCPMSARMREPSTDSGIGPVRVRRPRSRAARKGTARHPDVARRASGRTEIQ